MRKPTASELIDKFNNGTASAEEKAVLESWYLQQKPTDELPLIEDLLADQQRSKKILMREIGAGKTFKLWPRVAVAAAAVTAITLSIWIYTSRHPEGSEATRDLYANDIAPGKNNSATLTLADGKKILINNAASGQLAEQHGVKISKTADGQIIYELKDKGNGGGYNTLQTSNGEQTQVRLQDGSVVKLNAGSILIYPASFAGLKERRVKLKGEGHFAVHHDAKQPFRVEARGQVVEDIGTEFNINAYDDEPVVRTTLIEGLAKVIPINALSASGGEPSLRAQRDQNKMNTSSYMPKGQRGGEVLLKPNQQAVMTANNRLTVKTVDVNDFIDWQNNEFIFKEQTVADIMRKVSRWYDVEVIYENGIDTRLTFSGKVSRQKNISEVLKIIQSTGQIKFKIDGKKVWVGK